MNTHLYILLGWLVFVAVVYAYAFYDFHAERIDLGGRWRRLVDAFTEEE